MPIQPIVLQRRQAELGRIRLGQKQTTSNGRSRPAKLDKFRFTSVSETYIRDLAALYGGTPQPWDNNGIASWEVITTATTIPVIVVKNGLSQWMETWSGGGCTHRCDGEVNVLTNEPCDPNDRAHIDAKPTTRLSVMLPELEAIGAWRLESHGWNAAAEIPAVAELAQFVGDLVPAELHLVERRAVKDGKTSRFVVPVLDLKIGAAKLREIVADKAGLSELPSTGGAPALAAAPAPDYYALADMAGSAAAVRDVWRQAASSGHLDDALKAHLTARGKSFDQPQQIEAAPEPDEDGAVDGEIVDDHGPSAQDLWQQVVARGGELGMSMWDIEGGLKSDFDVAPHEATGEQLAAYLESLQGRGAA